MLQLYVNCYRMMNPVCRMKGACMKNKLLSLTLILVLVVSMLPFQYATAEDTARVTGGWLILRESASTSSRGLSSYRSGTVVTILQDCGNFYRVRTPDNLVGYMVKKYLIINSGSGLTNGCTAWITSPNKYNVNLRSGPGTGYKAIASYAKGIKVRVDSVGTTWCFVTIGGNVGGYIMTRYLTLTDPSSSVTTAYVTSKNGLGVALRNGPGKSYKAIANYAVGTEVSVIQWGTTWSQLKIGSRSGYMMTEFLTTTKPVTPTPPPGASIVISKNGKSVNMRSGPSMSSPSLGRYPVGTMVTIVTPGSVWDYIRIGTTYGYMMKQYISTP